MIYHYDNIIDECPYHRVTKKERMDSVALLQAEVCGALHCDLKDDVCSFFFSRQTPIENETFKIMIKSKLLINLFKANQKDGKLNVK